MITKEQALTAQRFHYPVSGTKCETWRRNGKTQVWKTRPDEFRVPVKFGLYGYDAITHKEFDLVHTEEDCPHA